MHNYNIFNICSFFSDKVRGAMQDILNAHLGINWEYSMNFRFYKMKACQDVSDFCRETRFRKLILKRYKQYGYPTCLGERVLSCFKLFRIVCTKILLPVVSLFEEMWVPKKKFSIALVSVNF